MFDKFIAPVIFIGAFLLGFCILLRWWLLALIVVVLVFMNWAPALGMEQQAIIIEESGDAYWWITGVTVPIILGVLAYFGTRSK